jgi:hypothetical protein
MEGRVRHDLLDMIAGPTIWAGYFLACYIAVAIACAKAADPSAALAAVRLGLAALTLAALAGIGLFFARAWRRWSRRAEPPPHGRDTAESRELFLALATLLLSGLSLVATLYVALPALFVTGCR